MKHLFQPLLLLLALLLPATATAYDFCVGGIYYLKNGNEATVTFKGSYSSQYNEYSGAVTIPAAVTYSGVTYSVTSIGNGAFSGCSSLTSVTIGNSVTAIGNSAFSGCSGLTSIMIPNSVTSIGDDAFYYCSGLASVEIPNSVTSIGYEAFYGCSGLASVIIPNSVTTIANYAFRGCRSLASVEIPNSVTSIGEGAFVFCRGLTSVTIGNSVISIGSNAFQDCSSLTSVSIPNSVTFIGYRAFSNTPWYNNQPDGLVYAGLVAYQYKGTMPNNTSITILDGTLGISTYAFEGCSGLTSVTIPNSVTSISESAFLDCSGLTSITVASGNSNYDSRNNCNAIIETESNTLIVGCQNTLIPNSVTSIANYAFYGCSGLSDINIPNSVTSIGEEAFGNTAWYDNQPDGLIYAGLVAYEYKGRMSDETSIVLKEGTLGIADKAFYAGYDWQVFSQYSGMLSITIPNSVINIGSRAFEGCTGLTSLTIPNSVSRIGEHAFIGCSGLTSIIVENGNTKYDSRDNCNAIIETESNELILGCQNTFIPNSVSSIGKSAFYWCTSLKSITIPQTITSIGHLAFGGCSNVTDVDCYISNLSDLTMYSDVWHDRSWGNNNYPHRVLHVPYGSLAAYQADENWYPYFGQIDELDPIPVTSIEIDRTVAVIIDGESLQLTATMLPENASIRTVKWLSNNPTVAMVDDAGLVTAHSVGTATITAMTMDGSYLSASCVVTVKSLSLNECLSMPDGEVLHGESITIPVRMTNDAAVLAFQTDIYLPEGFTLACNEDDEPIITPSDRLSSDHIIMTQSVSNGSVRVVCYTPLMASIIGHEGDLFYITVNVPDDAAGDYAVYLRNTRLTIDDFSETRIPDAGAVVTVEAFTPGDVNDTHTVNVADIVTTVRYVLEMNPSPFIFDAADMNNDGEVTVTDIMLIARLILSPTMNTPLRATALTYVNDRLSGEDIALNYGDTRTVSIALDNDMDYSAIQMDVTLPEGLTASNFALTDRAASHTLEVNTLTNGRMRALCYSPTIQAIDGNSGAVLTFDVTATAAVDGDITVNGIELVTTACQTVKPAAFTIGVQTATVVTELTANKTIARIEYFNLAGQRLERPVNGMTLIVTTYNDGTRTTTKLLH